MHFQVSFNFVQVAPFPRCFPSGNQFLRSWWKSLQQAPPRHIERNTASPEASNARLRVECGRCCWHRCVCFLFRSYTHVYDLSTLVGWTISKEITCYFLKIGFIRRNLDLHEWIRWKTQFEAVWGPIYSTCSQGKDMWWYTNFIIYELPQMHHHSSIVRVISTSTLKQPKLWNGQKFLGHPRSVDYTSYPHKRFHWNQSIGDGKMYDTEIFRLELNTLDMSHLRRPTCPINKMVHQSQTYAKSVDECS